jgi:hypothetical protein
VDRDGDGIADSYFTSDPAQLSAATAQLRTTDRTTNYINALGETYFEMRTEMLGADKESLPLSKYMVVFVSDGIPDVDTDDERRNSEENIVGSVRALLDLAGFFRVGSFSFHTAFVATPSAGAGDRAAQDLLKRMGETGGGTYRNFTGGESLNFFHIDFTVMKRVFALRSVVAVNTAVVMDRTQIPAGDAGFDAGPPDAGAAGGDGGWDGGDAGVPDAAVFVDLDKDNGLECGEPMLDSDGDGLSDSVEHGIATDPLESDTDGDGLSDRVEWEMRSSGLDPLDPADSGCFVPSLCMDADGNRSCDCVRDADSDGVCDCVNDPERPCLDAAGRDCIDADHDGLCDCPDRNGDGRCDYPDSDGDGLSDCEEVFYGADPRSVDTDADGLPDPVEVRFRSNPLVADTLSDLDWDHTANRIEVLTGTNILCDDAAYRRAVAYRHAVVETGKVGSSTCYRFSIENITLVPTAGNPAARFPGNGWNRILIFAGETAFDDPGATAAYRVACVMANYEPDGDYKMPPSGRFEISETDFLEAKDFDPDVNCIWP